MEICTSTKTKLELCTTRKREDCIRALREKVASIGRGVHGDFCGTGLYFFFCTGLSNPHAFISLLFLIPYVYIFAANQAGCRSFDLS